MPRLPAELEEVLARCVRGPRLVREAVDGAGPEVISRAGSGGWSVRDVLVHLADAELVRAGRLRFILAAEEPPALPGFDEGVWKRRLQYLWRSPEAALALYDALVYSNAELLRQFAMNPGVPISREELAGGSGGTESERAVDVQINRLRQKIEVDPSNPVYLQTVRGRGYVLYTE